MNLEQGVRTAVAIRRSPKDRSSVRLNGRTLIRPSVSKRVIDDYVALSGGHWRVRVEHQCKLPVGAGYGTSGAGATSLSLALNSAFGSQLSRLEALKIAHIADARAKTGLGTVASVSQGGLAVRLEPGAPGVGMVKNLTIPTYLRVVSASFAPLSTKRVLSSDALRKRVNLCSRGLVDNLLRRRDASSFVSLSRRFSDCLGLVSARLRVVLDALDERRIVASMMMVGDGAFCMVPRKKASGVAKLFRTAGMSTLISGVGRRGAHIV